MSLNCLKIVFVLLSLSRILYAAPHEPIPHLPIKVDLSNKARLQRGAKIFMNYCSGCHSLRYMRYSQMGKDLGLTTFEGHVDKDLLFNNLIFTQAAIQDPIRISMPAVDARQWFGILPPDLSLVARKRGPSWLYTYLKSFYVDKSRPFGTNNLLIPNLAMPNVLEPLSGQTILPLNKDPNAEWSSRRIIPGEMGSLEFDSTLSDLVHFLVYVGEPARLIRYKIGVGVLIFLFILLAFSYNLKKAYWQKLKKQ